MYEQARIISVNSHKDVRWLNIHKDDLALAFQKLSTALRDNNLPLPQMLDTEKRNGACAFLVTAPKETLTAIEHLTERIEALEFDDSELCSVTATCQGAYASPLPDDIAQALAQLGIPVRKMLFGPMSVKVILDAKDRDKAVQTLHDMR